MTCTYNCLSWIGNIVERHLGIDVIFTHARLKSTNPRMNIIRMEVAKMTSNDDDLSNSAEITFIVPFYLYVKHIKYHSIRLLKAVTQRIYSIVAIPLCLKIQFSWLIFKMSPISKLKYCTLNVYDRMDYLFLLYIKKLTLVFS